MLAQGTVKAQDATDNSAMNSDSGNTDNTVAPGDAAALLNNSLQEGLY